MNKVLWKHGRGNTYLPGEARRGFLDKVTSKQRGNDGGFPPREQRGREKRAFREQCLFQRIIRYPEPGEHVSLIYYCPCKGITSRNLPTSEGPFQRQGFTWRPWNHPVGKRMKITPIVKTRTNPAISQRNQSKSQSWTWHSCF